MRTILDMVGHKTLVVTFVALVIIIAFLLLDTQYLRKDIRDPHFTEWSQWSHCTKSCEGGVKYRKRFCIVDPFDSKRNCERLGRPSEAVPCHTYVKRCPIDGGFGEWSPFTPCSVSCGGGYQHKSRKCDNPPPQHGGKYCPPEPAILKQECNTQPCPTHGGYSNWGTWSQCTVTCGGGEQKRTRKCDNPIPNNRGNDCTSIGPAEESKKCNEMACQDEQKKKEEEKKEQEKKEQEKKELEKKELEKKVQGKKEQEKKEQEKKEQGKKEQEKKEQEKKEQEKKEQEKKEQEKKEQEKKEQEKKEQEKKEQEKKELEKKEQEKKEQEKKEQEKKEQQKKT